MRGAHDGICRSDDGHQMCFVSGIDGGVPFFQVQGSSNSCSRFEPLENDGLRPVPVKDSVMSLALSAIFDASLTSA